MSRFHVLKARSAGALSGLETDSLRTSKSRLLLFAQMKSLRLPGVSEALPLLPVRHSRVFFVPSSRHAPSSVFVSASVQSLVYRPLLLFFMMRVTSSMEDAYCAA